MEFYSGDGGSSCSSSADGVFGTIQSEVGCQINPYDHHHQHKDDHIHDHHLQVNERQADIISSDIEPQGFLVFPSSQSVVVNPPWPSSSTIPITNTTICPIEDHHGGRIIDHSIQPQQQQTQLPIMSAGLLDDFHGGGGGGGGIRTMQFGYHELGLQQIPPPMANFSNPLELYMAGTTCVVPDAFFRSSGHAKYMPTSATTLSPFGCSLQSELGKMTAQEIMDAKALAASKSHSEAERRRRERINAHLSRLRSLLPSTTKTDKASLLAEVIQHVKELKRQTSHIVEESPIPSESDELTVDAANDEEGKFVLKASMCCDDRSDLLTDLIKALKALNLKTLKAEITTLGGRVKNVLLITGENNDDVDDETHQHQHHSISTVQDALKAVMERSAVANINNTSSASSTTVAASGSGGMKRQRTTNLSSILENRP